MTSSYAFQQNLSDLIVEIPADSILSRTVYHDDQIKLTLFGFSPGQELSEHTASTPAMIQILEGQARVTLGGDTLLAGPGFWVHMPANLVHSLLAETKTLMLMTMIKQPK